MAGNQNTNASTPGNLERYAADYFAARAQFIRAVPQLYVTTTAGKIFTDYGSPGPMKPYKPSVVTAEEVRRLYETAKGGKDKIESVGNLDDKLDNHQLDWAELDKTAQAYQRTADAYQQQLDLIEQQYGVDATPIVQLMQMKAMQQEAGLIQDRLLQADTSQDIGFTRAASDNSPAFDSVREQTVNVDQASRDVAKNSGFIDSAIKQDQISDAIKLLEQSRFNELTQDKGLVEKINKTYHEVEKSFDESQKLERETLGPRSDAGDIGDGSQYASLSDPWAGSGLDDDFSGTVRTGVDNTASTDIEPTEVTLPDGTQASVYIEPGESATAPSMARGPRLDPIGEATTFYDDTTGKTYLVSADGSTRKLFVRRVLRARPANGDLFIAPADAGVCTGAAA